MTNNEHRYNPDIHRRRSVRLRDYDYSQQGLYFVTLCVKKHECMFGEIRMDDCACTGRARPAPIMHLNDIGEIVRREWLRTAELRENVTLHNFVVMPNHFHGILEITGVQNGNYVLPDDDGATVGAGRALPLHDAANDDVGAGRALPLHDATDDDARAGRALPPHVPTRTNELPKSRFQNIGKNTLSSIIGCFKSAVTKNIHDAGYEFAWQRNMWEHVIRDFNDYARIADYIDNNPARWTEDQFYKE